MTTIKNINQLQDALNVIRMQAVESAKESARVMKLAEQAIEMVRGNGARGTGDVTEAAHAAATKIAEEKMPERIHAAIEKDGPATVAELAQRLGEPAARVQRTVKKLRAAGQLRNVGSPLEPVWWWAVGDGGDTGELRDSVARLLSHRPMTLLEIVNATGARRNRISGVLVKLQVSGVPVRNLGDGQRAVWSVGRKPHR